MLLGSSTLLCGGLSAGLGHPQLQDDCVLSLICWVLSILNMGNNYSEAQPHCRLARGKTSETCTKMEGIENLTGPCGSPLLKQVFKKNLLFFRILKQLAGQFEKQMDSG